MYNVQIYRIFEKGFHRKGNDFAYGVDGAQLFDGGTDDAVDVVILGYDGLGNHFAYIADAQSEQHPLEGHGFRLLQCVDDILGGLLLEADLIVGQTVEFAKSEAIEVGYILDQAGIVEELHLAFSKTFNVHGLTADEMLDAAFHLRRTALCVRTVPGGFVLVLYQLGAAYWTDLSKSHGLRSCLTFVEVHSNDFRYDFATFHHSDGVAIM